MLKIKFHKELNIDDLKAHKVKKIINKNKEIFNLEKKEHSLIVDKTLITFLIQEEELIVKEVDFL